MPFSQSRCESQHAQFDHGVVTSFVAGVSKRSGFSVLLSSWKLFLLSLFHLTIHPCTHPTRNAPHLRPHFVFGVSIGISAIMVPPSIAPPRLRKAVCCQVRDFSTGMPVPAPVTLLQHLLAGTPPSPTLKKKSATSAETKSLQDGQKAQEGQKSVTFPWAPSFKPQVLPPLPRSPHLLPPMRLWPRPPRKMQVLPLLPSQPPTTPVAPEVFGLIPLPSRLR